MPRPLNHKPGTRKGLFVPDVIETYRPEGPTRLLDFLIESMPQRKRTNIKELLAHDQVAVNGAPTRQFDTGLSAGDEVKINLVRPFLTFRNRRLRLVFEDDDIIVVDKGYGLLSMGTDKIKEGTAYSILRDYVKWSNPRNKIFIVHRLDRDTSGLMMFAKNQQAKETMQHNWNNMVLERNYVVLSRDISKMTREPSALTSTRTPSMKSTPLPGPSTPTASSPSRATAFSTALTATHSLN